MSKNNKSRRVQNSKRNRQDGRTRTTFARALGLEQRQVFGTRNPWE